jgi:hypothetical protein
MASRAPRNYTRLMKPWKPVLALLLLSCGTIAAPAADRIFFEQLVLDTRDADLVKTVDSILERTRSTLATLHGQELAPSEGAGASFALKTSVSRDA